jgi:uncharacterized protein (DUF2062 family)
MIEIWKAFVIPILVVIAITTAFIGMTFFVLYSFTTMFDDWTMQKREARKAKRLINQSKRKSLS